MDNVISVALLLITLGPPLVALEYRHRRTRRNRPNGVTGLTGAPPDRDLRYVLTAPELEIPNGSRRFSRWRTGSGDERVGIGRAHLNT